MVLLHDAAHRRKGHRPSARCTGVGSEMGAGRINTLVAAITAGLTVDQLNDLDLVYAPPVALVYDPILIAVSQAVKTV